MLHVVLSANYSNSELSGQVSKRNDRQLCADTSELTMGMHTKFMPSMMILKAMPGHPTSPYKASMLQDARHNGQTLDQGNGCTHSSKILLLPTWSPLPIVTNREFSRSCHPQPYSILAFLIWIPCTIMSEVIIKRETNWWLHNTKNSLKVATVGMLINKNENHLIQTCSHFQGHIKAILKSKGGVIEKKFFLFF